MYMNAIKYFLPETNYDLFDNNHIGSSPTKLSRVNLSDIKPNFTASRGIMPIFSCQMLENNFLFLCEPEKLNFLIMRQVYSIYSWFFIMSKITNRNFKPEFHILIQHTMNVNILIFLHRMWSNLRQKISWQKNFFYFPLKWFSHKT